MSSSYSSVVDRLYRRCWIRILTLLLISLKLNPDPEKDPSHLLYLASNMFTRIDPIQNEWRSSLLCDNPHSLYRTLTALLIFYVVEIELDIFSTILVCVIALIADRFLDTHNLSVIEIATSTIRTVVFDGFNVNLVSCSVWVLPDVRDNITYLIVIHNQSS